jgi:hypothetical protein
MTNVMQTQADSNDDMMDDDTDDGRKKVEIRAEHIAKIAAEWLMDYS